VEATEGVSIERELILRRPIDSVDDQHLESDVFRLQTQPELFPERREDRHRSKSSVLVPGTIGMNSTSKSNLPVSPVRLTTGRSTARVGAFVSELIGIPFIQIRVALLTPPQSGCPGGFA
jgi:hypothetical protein